MPYSIVTMAAISAYEAEKQYLEYCESCKKLNIAPNERLVLPEIKTEKCENDNWLFACIGFIFGIII